MLDRFGQIEPKVLICPDGYYYNGKSHDSLARVAEFSEQLPTLKTIVVVPYVSASPDLSGISRAQLFDDFIADQPGGEIPYRQVAFNAPLYIMYSSGTTGKPKCIVHGVGSCAENSAMLATASLGAVWSSCSPDFGVQGVLDRFGQIEPKVLICPDGYYYNGKSHDSLARVAEFSEQLPTLKTIVVVPYVSASPDLSGISRAQLFDDFIADQPGGEIPYRQVAFNAPLYIMYSSGTTGKPAPFARSLRPD